MAVRPTQLQWPALPRGLCCAMLCCAGPGWAGLQGLPRLPLGASPGAGAEAHGLVGVAKLNVKVPHQRVDKVLARDGEPEARLHAAGAGHNSDRNHGIVSRKGACTAQGQGRWSRGLCCWQTLMPAGRLPAQAAQGRLAAETAQEPSQFQRLQRHAGSGTQASGTQATPLAAAGVAASPGGRQQQHICHGCGKKTKCTPKQSI